MSLSTIISENKAYWTRRAHSYSQVSREELSGTSHIRWRNCLSQRIRTHFPDRPASQIRVLEIGTGPGFFAILLCEMGYEVTAVDLTAAMLEQARENAGRLAEQICFMEMNAEALAFEDGYFDVVISRNLTWNLPHPEKAYAEWARVLSPGGLLLNFDANWYAYLFDADARTAFDEDRAISAREGVPDQNVGDGFDVMEGIARRIPLSAARRPRWDLDMLTCLGLRAGSDETVWQQVWSRQEKLNFASTPMFMVYAAKV